MPRGQVLAVRRTAWASARCLSSAPSTAAAQRLEPAGTNRRVDTAPDPASHFVIYVNGEPIMVKGTNWVPLDAFHSRDAERVGAGARRCSTTSAAT